MPTNMPCPSCGGPVPVDREMTGLYVQCSRCGVQFEVPPTITAWVPPAARPKPAPPPAERREQAPRSSGENQSEGGQALRSSPEGSEVGWDLPDADAPEPANVGPVDARTNRPVVRKLWLAGAAALVIVCVIVAMNWSGRPPVGEPSAEMWAMGRDVTAGPWLVRVDGFDWTSDPANPRSTMLSVRLTLTNSGANELSTPEMYLGSTRAKSLASDFGQPVLKTSSGEGVFKVAPAATVSGALLFPAPKSEYCLLVVPSGSDPVPINLTVSSPRLKE